MSTIYLIRHAQASFGAADYDRLSDAGRRQAEILADHFNDLGLEFDAIYSGSQLRHAQTHAACLERFRGPENTASIIHKTDAFNEYDSEKILKTLIPMMIREEPAFAADAAAMMKDKRSFQKVYEPVMRRWVAGEKPLKNLETWQSYSDRVIEGLNAIMTAQGSGKKIAVFTSGGPISVCVQKALGLTDETALRLTWQIMNASVTRLKYSGTQTMLFGFNDVTHLMLKRDDALITYR